MTKSGPPSSSRTPFPLVAKSPAMEAFLHAVQKRTKHNCAVPLVVGPNRLELPTFLDTVMKRLGIVSYGKVHGNEPSPIELDMDNRDGLVFMNGDRLSPALQMRYVSGRYQHLATIIVVTQDPRPPLDAEGAGTTGWSQEFRNCCSTIAIWPSWNQRNEDHRDIIRAIYDRLGMPRGRDVPVFDRSAMDYLLTQPFRGTDEVEAEMKRALNTYIRAQARGPVNATYFAGPQKLKVLTEMRREVRSTPPPPEPAA